MLAIIKSSREMVKLRSQPENSAGAINGRVIKRITVNGLAPKFKAASSSDESKSANFACTISAI